jgi:PKD repeat protein
MRRILILTLLLLTLGLSTDVEIVTFEDSWAQDALFNVVSSTPTGVDLVFSTKQMYIENTMINGAEMNTIGVPGIFLPNDEGAPNLAGTARYIAIPQGSRAVYTIVRKRTEVYHDMDIAPAPVLPLDSDNAPLRYEKDLAVYGRNAYYPNSVVDLSEPIKIRGVDVVLLGVTPFQYNPVTRDLIVYTDIQVRVDFIGGNGHFGDDRLRSRFWEPVLEQNLLNYGSLPRIDFYKAANLNTDANGYEYIIIVPDDPVFETWANTIKDFRQEQGISSQVYTLTDIGGTSSSAIESFLNNAYNTWNPAPAAFLILSDYPSSGDGYGVTSPYWNSYCVSDNIYADVNGDDLPDMHHARICAQTETQLSTMINKFLSYETNPYTDAGFYNHPIVAAAWQTERWFQLCGEVVRGFFINGLGKDPVRQNNIYSGTPTVGGAWSTATNTSTVVNYFYNLGWLSSTTNQHNESWWDNGSAAQITNAINDGAFLIQHRDHGSVSGWGEPAYHLGDLDDLTNDMYIFVNSTNCETGMYDYSSEVFAEKFHRIQHGALAVNAATEVSYSFVNDTYVWGMYDYLWPQFDPGYGATGSANLLPCAAMTSGKYYLEASSWPYNSSSKVYTYHLFHHHGDAFSVLYSEIPQNLSVSHASTLPAGQTYFTVTANSGAVIALTVNGEIIAKAQATGSAQNIQIPAQTAGNTMKVVVTMINYYRYSSEVAITGTGTAPTAEFTGAPTSGTAPLTVNFTDESQGSVTSWDWNFGDGSAHAYTPSPVHEYTNPDTYTVSLTVSNAYGSDTETKTNYILVSESGGWTVITYDDFESGMGTYTDGGNDMSRYTGGTYAHQENCAADIQDNSGTASSFYHTSTYDVSGYNELEIEFWFYAVSMESGEDFWVQYYDGSTWRTVAAYARGTDFNNNTFYNKVVTISRSQYNFPTNARIRFMCDASGNYDDVYIDEIEFRGSGASGPNPPTAEFTGTPTSGTAPLSVSFTDESQGQPTSWNWNFGDGSAHSYIKNPVHEYTVPGDYTVSLTVANDYGSDTETKTDYIDVREVTQPAFYDDFDDGNANGWTTSGLWHVTTYRANSPSYSLAYNQESGHTYATGAQTTGGAEFSTDLPTDAVLEFYHCYWTESYSSAAYDVCRVQIYNNGSWQTLMQWDSRDPNVTSWTHVLIDLSAYSGTVSLRFYFDSIDGLYNDYEGWYIDNVEVKPADNDSKTALLKPILYSEQGDPRDIIPILFSASCAPNPFKDIMSINYAMPVKTYVEITVFNTLGQQVKKLVDQEMEPGFYTTQWDGKDTHNKKANAGVYFFKIKCSDEFEHIGKFIFMK